MDVKEVDHESVLDAIAKDIQEREPRARFLLKQYGSFRRLMCAYWKGQLTAKDEAELESTFRPEDRMGYKPLVGW